MKDQYFGDVNDYRKYGLLRVLTDRGALSLGVCWMLTSADGGADGKFIDYLNEPTYWRHYDSELYDALRRCVRADGDRTVKRADCLEILPNARFYTSTVADDAQLRGEYFADALGALRESDLLFFDPDNGMEIHSKRYGSRDSSKYLYWLELESAFSAGHSLLIYQHFHAKSATRSLMTSPPRWSSERGLAASTRFVRRTWLSF